MTYPSRVQSSERRLLSRACCAGMYRFLGVDVDGLGQVEIHA